jgi:hypothetical protein
MNETAPGSPESEFIPADPRDKLMAIEAEALLLAAAVRLIKRHPVALLAAASIVVLAVVLKRAR